MKCFPTHRAFNSFSLQQTMMALLADAYRTRDAGVSVLS